MDRSEKDRSNDGEDEDNSLSVDGVRSVTDWNSLCTDAGGVQALWCVTALGIGGRMNRRIKGGRARGAT